jgi:hypothetical protein
MPRTHLRAPLLIALLTCLLPIVGVASSTSYVIQFNVDPLGLPEDEVGPTSGGFLYDASNATAPFSNFLVVWNGAVFDLTTKANSTGVTGFGCDSQTASPQLGINVMFQSFVSPCTNETYFWEGDYNTGASIEQVAFFVQNSSSFMSTGFGEFHTLNSPNGTFFGRGSFEVSAAPEPATLTQFAGGVLIMGLWVASRLRRRIPR